MELPRYQSSFLLNQFREFYAELARLKRTVEVAGSVYVFDLPTTDHPDPTTTANGVWQHLLSVLERQALEAGQTGGAFAFEIYREAQYVMAALADEIFLHFNWDGRANWPLLENKLFSTHIAGEVIFQRLDRLLQRRDPFYLDLAAVYFMALSLGFQGKFRGSDPGNSLEQYKRQLFAMIYRRNPQLFVTNNSIFPQTYQNTLDRGTGRKLPNQNIWYALIAGVLVIWILASQVAWASVSGEVSSLICQANNAMKTGSAICPVVTSK
jgi:type VI secretion system protein ImpK